MLKAKLHRTTVTHAELSYEDSLSIDQELMAAVGLRQFERIHMCNINNGERFETYAIKAPGDSGTIGLNERQPGRGWSEI